MSESCCDQDTSDSTYIRGVLGGSTDYLTDRPVLTGLLGVAGLLVFYIGVLTLSNSFSHAVNEFQRFWYLIFPLVGLFGVQMGVFAYMMRQATVSGSSVAATGGVSGGAMVACCLHHVFELLPFLGMTGVALMLADHQASFLTIGILSGVMGLVWMLRTMQQHDLHTAHPLWKHVMSINWTNHAIIVMMVGSTGIMVLIYRIIGDIL